VALKRLLAATVLVLRRGAGSLIATAGTREAAQVAYYLVMSFPAILILLVWAFSTVLDDPSVRDKIVDAIVSALPLSSPGDRRQVETLLDEVAAGAGSLGWIGALSLLYSASAAVGALRFAVNNAWGLRDERPYFLGKALDVGVTLVAAPVVLAALGLTLSGALADAIGDHPWLVAAAQFGITRLLPVALLFVLLAGLYRVLPASRTNVRSAWPGALVALVGILAVQLGSSAYFALAGDANAIYGTLGILLAIVFSAYVVAVVIVFGAHVGAQVSKLPDQAAIERALDTQPEQRSTRHAILGAVRGLFVRARPR
jgi:membrane protein